MQTPSLPYRLLILAPFTGEQAGVWSGAPLRFDPQEPDSLAAALHPSVTLSLPTELCPEGGLQLSFSSRKDFTPDGLLAKQPFLKALMDADRFLADAARKNLSEEDVQRGLAAWPGLPPIAYRQKGKPAAGSPGAGALDSLLAMVDLPSAPDRTPSPAADGYSGKARRILDQIFADPSFRMIESAWQGLNFLAKACPGADAPEIAVVPVGRAFLEETLETLVPFLVRNPFSLILVDIPFGGSQGSIAALSKLAEYGQLLLVPVFAWVTAGFFQVNAWDDIDRLAFLPHHFEQQSFAKWNTLRRSPAARWLCLLCNRFLGRFPYGPDNPTRGIDFIETGLPWLSPIWAAAASFCRRLVESKWPSGIGVRLDGLGLDMSANPPRPVEKPFSEDRLDQLHRSGIAALAAEKGRDSAFLYSGVMASPDSTLDYQSLVCLATRFTLWCKDNFPEEMDERELAAAVSDAWERYLDERQTDHRDMPLYVKTDTVGGKTTLRLQWRPSTHVLRSGEELVLEFSW